MLKYFSNHTAAEMTIRYKVSRKTLYKWKNRYDGTLGSLKDTSRKPHNSPKSKTSDEINIVKRIWSKDKDGDKLVMWHNARKKGYERCYQTFLRTIRRFGGVKPRKKPKKPNPIKWRSIRGRRFSSVEVSRTAKNIINTRR